MTDLVGNPEDRFSHNEAKVLVDDRKKLGMDSADPMHRSE